MAKAPRFQVEVLRDRTVTVTTHTKNPNKEKDNTNFIITMVERIIPISFMVYFPGGHSVWYETKADMAQAGIIESENHEIDLETGLPVNPEVIFDLKARVERNTRRPNRMEA